MSIKIMNYKGSMRAFVEIIQAGQSSTQIFKFRLEQ